MIQVHEVKNKTATINVDGVLLSFMMRKYKGKIMPRMVARSGYDGTRVPYEAFQQARRQAAAILKKELEKGSTETHPM